MALELTIYTATHFTKEHAEDFYNIFLKHNLLPSKITSDEIPKMDFTLEEGIKFWTQYCETNELFSIKSTEFGYLGEIQFRNNHIEMKPAFIHFEFNKKILNKRFDSIHDFFIDLVHFTDAYFAFISESEPFYRQHVSGNILQRLNGVFWCNYYGNKLTKYIGVEKIVNYPWADIRILENGIVTYLDEHPFGEIIKSPEKEQNAKSYLGTSKFNGKDPQYPKLWENNCSIKQL